MTFKKNLIAAAVATASLGAVQAYGAIIVAGAPTVDLNADTIAATATSSNLVLNFGASTDAVVGSTIVLTLPTGVKFNAAPSGTPSGSLNLGAGATTAQAATLSSNNTVATWTVAAAPAAGDAMTVNLKDVATLMVDSTTGASLNVDGLQATLTTNGGTSQATSSSIGDIAVLQQPAIASAVIVSNSAVDVYFDVELSTDDTVSVGATSATAVQNSVDDAAAANIDFVIAQGSAASAPTIGSATGKVYIDPDNAKLVHITNVTSTNGLAAGNTIVYSTANSGSITNALGGVKAVTTATAVPVNPASATVTSVAVTGAPVYAGSSSDTYNTSNGAGQTADVNANEFALVVTGTAGATVSLRAQNADASSTDTTGILFDTDSTAGGEATSFAIPSDGTLELYARVANTSLVAAGAEGNVVIAASVDGFSTSATSGASDVTVDRKRPSVTSAASTGRNNVTVTLSETMSTTASTAKGLTAIATADADNNATVNTVNADTLINLGGTNSGAALQSLTSVSYDGSTTLTLTTNLLAAAADNTAALESTATDRAGNKADTTASSVFSTQGVAVTSITGGALSGTAAIGDSVGVVSGVTKISNGDTVAISVVAPTGLTVDTDPSNGCTIGQLCVRAVNASDNSTTNITQGGTLTLSEVTAGNYTGTMVFGSTTLSAGTTLALQASADNFAQSVVDSTNTYTVDNTAPTVASVTAQGNRATLVTFSEAMNTTADLWNSGAAPEAAGTDGTADLLDPKAYGISDGTNSLAISSVTLLSSTQVLLTHAAATEGTSYTVTADLAHGIMDTTNNDMVASNTATFTGAAADTTAPTASVTGAVAGDTTVVVTVSDDNGSGNIDFTTVEVNSVSVNGTPVSTTFTTSATNSTVTFTLPTALAEGDTVVVAFNVADRSSNTANLVVTTTAEAALVMPETASVVAGNTTTLTPTSGTAVSFSSSDETVATVTSAGVVTGVAAGTATITATDASGNSVTTTVTVAARAAEVSLTTTSALGNTTDATITGGVTNDGGATIGASGTYAATDSLDVFGTINVDSNDVGAAGDILVVAVLNGQLFMKTSATTWEVWDGTAEGLTPLETIAALSATETVEVASGLTGLAGDFQVFVGYQNGAGDIIYSSSPITFTVE